MNHPKQRRILKQKRDISSKFRRYIARNTKTSHQIIISKATKGRTDTRKITTRLYPQIRPQHKPQ
jgi:hypothetical protein